MSGPALVTCVMPTCDRRPFVPHAVECFLRQDYPNLELLVIDDGDDPVADLMPPDPRIRYVRQDPRLTIGVKRNLMCNLAGGDMIVHWDDDDWSAPWRVRYQVGALESSGAELCGLSRVRFYAPAVARGWEYRYPDGARPWVHGATLCYRKAFWRGNPFPEIPFGEDTRFVWSERVRQLLTLDDARFFLGTLHPGNASPKRTSDARWSPYPVGEIEAMLGDEWPRYRAAVTDRPLELRTQLPHGIAEPRTGHETTSHGPSRARADGTATARRSRPPSTRRIRIGIHLYQDVRRLQATIAGIRANTNGPFELMLLPDGPDAEMRGALSTLSDLPNSGSVEPRGAAASFNRLASAGDADVVVLLESGCLVAPGWLDCLLAALDGDAHNGLAGPTTNICWNEQCVYPQGGDSAEQIARTARDAASRFGGATRTLEPLHSLADFCYAVHREVIETIGAADEAYGLGPCWEMDYNVRAARAGFRGVWACAAYVHRMRFTARRTAEEASRFEASKRRYQDKFCGARLQGHKADYRSHCRGDACPNFAPVSLIAIRGPLAAAPAAGAVPLARTPAIAVSGEPLVSCVMPTSNRRRFVRQAIRCFLRQDYLNTELVVLDDGTDAVGDCIPEDSRIRYVRLDRTLTLGAKRNLACSEARGDVIVHWDDDDWYPPCRVRLQVRALLDRPSEVCGTSRVLYYEASTDRAWEYRHAAGGASWLAGNSLAYRKEFWARNRFPDIQAGEDAHFVWNSRNAALADLGENRLCVGMIHAGNTSRKETGGAFWHLQPSGDVQALLGDDVHFYRTIEPADPPDRWPMVSCIMPTYNRRALVAIALQLFDRQDYPHRELIVVDDGEDAIGDLVSNVPDVRYFRLSRRTPIGAKRNFACQQARGEIIAHWDDDDWYAPERLRYQVAPILTGQADLTGLENAFVLEAEDGRFWTTRQGLHRQMFFGNVHGGTLAFRKQVFAEGVRYPELDLAEDAWLLDAALKRGKRLLRLANPGVFVYMRHGRNAWRDCVPGRYLDPAGWERVARPPTFSVGMLSAYQAAAASTRMRQDAPS